MQRENRRLAAIVAADVAGFSRLIGRNEEATLRALRAHRRELIDPLIEDHGGRIANTAGDSMLLEFSSTVDAMRGALAIQAGMAERNRDVDADRRIRFRIGVNVGDVVSEGEDLLGDAVNVAARLQEIAEAGGICISRRAHEDVQDRLDTVFDDLGEHSLKNIDRPVHVWRWRADGTSAPTAAISAAAALRRSSDRPSIAVLPFDNLSGDPDQEYFADGIAEDIITALSKFRWFFVIARNSSFTYKDKPVDVKQVARELGVRYVLKGSVRRAGSRVRISAQLLDAQSSNHVWAERYDRELADIFDLQDEMTETIVGAIEPELGAAERERTKRKPPDNIDAWDRYQRGLWHLWRYTRDDYGEAEKLFQNAIDLDPGFGRAYASAAFLLNSRIVFGWTDTPDQTLGQALQAGKQAVSLDDKDAFSHFVLGRIHTTRGDLEGAIDELNTSIELNHNLAIAYFGLGLALNWSGRAQEALTQAHKAIRRSPHDPALWSFENLAGVACTRLGEYADAVEWLRKAARHPNSSFYPNLNLAVAFYRQEDLDRSRAALDAALEMRPDLSVAAVARMLYPMRSDLKDLYLETLRDAGLPE